MNTHGLTATQPQPRRGTLDFNAPGAWAVIDIANSERWSAFICEYGVFVLITAFRVAALAGVTHLFIKHPYRWSPDESYIFGGTVPGRAAALHSGIELSRSDPTLLLPQLICYQSLPDRLPAASPTDPIANLLRAQASVFDLDWWDEGVGGGAVRRHLIPERAALRPQGVEPVWDRGYHDQFGFPCAVTEQAARDNLGNRAWDWTAGGRNTGIACWMYRQLGDHATHDSALAACRDFRDWCAIAAPRPMRPVYPLDVFTDLGVTAQEIEG